MDVISVNKKSNNENIKRVRSMTTQNISKYARKLINIEDKINVHDYFLHQRPFTNVKIIINQQTVWCDKASLSAASPIFREQLLKNHKDEPLIFNDIDLNDFIAMLEFIYPIFNPEINEKNISCLIELSYRFQYDMLEQACQIYILKYLSTIRRVFGNTHSFEGEDGTPPTQFAVGPPSSSSPRVSIQSNNSASPNSDRNMSSQTRGRRPSMFDPIDPKELQQALYASAAAKANLPLNPSNEDDLTRPLSRITISYDRDSEHVFIDTLSFENLQMLDSYTNNNNNNNNDSVSFYCRFRLLPEKRTLFQTRIVRVTRVQTSYLFDKKQLKEFELSYDQLINHSIEIFFYKINTIKPLYKDIRIAKVKYDLSQLSEMDQTRMKKTLDECDSSSIIQDPDLGELLVSLSYLQSAAKLSIVVIEAKNLRPLSIETKSYPDACVKVTLYDRNGKKMKRKKTSVQRTSDYPTFNEELVFELRRDVASEVTIELRVVHESLSYKEQLGSVVFGPIVNHMVKGPIYPENVYWSKVLSGQSLNAQWQILKPSIRIEESK
ncbi:unnamed protein product [Rotaria magnacalcarata]|uniref:Uncharacterized protein n=1 Tax=Rotaria magnacalcarata TaxID=392030 RepID=A0A814XTT9_9BILA|nr:unnamed protein product [Rotaria magnacalcarata]